MQLSIKPHPALDSSVGTPNTSTQSGHKGRVDRLDGVPFLPDGFDCDLYTPIRLYSLAAEDKEMLTKLVDLQTGHDEILCMLELEDESLELGVLKTYIPELKKLLNTKILQHSVDWEHRPFDPSLKDVKSFYLRHPELSDDCIEGKARMRAQFCKRAERMVTNGWFMQKAWYSHLLRLIPE